MGLLHIHMAGKIEQILVDFWQSLRIVEIKMLPSKFLILKSSEKSVDDNREICEIFYLL